MKQLDREILSAFWKVHTLHPASEQPLDGQGMRMELARHRYQISPGTLYPVPQRLERLGWRKSKATPRPGRARKEYRLTGQGRKVLDKICEPFTELYDKVARGVEEERNR